MGLVVIAVLHVVLAHGCALMLVATECAMSTDLIVKILLQTPGHVYKLHRLSWGMSGQCLLLKNPQITRLHQTGLI